MHTLNFRFELSLLPLTRTHLLAHTHSAQQDPSLTLSLSDWLFFCLPEFPAHDWAVLQRLVCRSIVDNPLSLALSAHAHSHTLLLSLSPSSLSLSLSHFTIIFNKKPSHLEAWWWKNTSQELTQTGERERKTREREKKIWSESKAARAFFRIRRARYFFFFAAAAGAVSAEIHRRKK